MQLYLVRHAESQNNARPENERVEDPPITDVGHQQANCLAEWLRSLKIHTLICSPVRRALQTTRYVVKSTGSHVHVWADVFEEGGIYSGYGPSAIAGGKGLSRADVIDHVADSAEHCTLDESIVDDGWWGERNRETPEQAHHRAGGVKRRLIDTFGADATTVVAIIHADFKRRMLSHLLGDSIESIGLGHLRNTGVTKLDYDGHDWTLDWFNSISHLPNDLITGGGG
ncbi:MAG: histidine phosphatase family protein [Planctomycetota bacterium]